MLGKPIRLDGGKGQKSQPYAFHGASVPNGAGGSNCGVVSLENEVGISIAESNHVNAGHRLVPLAATGPKSLAFDFLPSSSDGISSEYAIKGQGGSRNRCRQRNRQSHCRTVRGR